MKKKIKKIRKEKKMAKEKKEIIEEQPKDKKPEVPTEEKIAVKPKGVYEQ